MKIYELRKTQAMPITMDEAWHFFSAAANLEKITPPEMSFNILTKLTDDPIYSGMKIKYTVTPLLGIPLPWTTEIRRVDPPFTFTDTQIKGPYSLWEHTHIFEPIPGGVKMTDLVSYALPMGVLGILAYRIIVKKKLNEIFDYREQALKKIFGTL